MKADELRKKHQVSKLDMMLKQIRKAAKRGNTETIFNAWEEWGYLQHAQDLKRLGYFVEKEPGGYDCPPLIRVSW